MADITLADLERLNALEKAATAGTMHVERREIDCGYFDFIIHGGPKGADFAWCREELDAKAKHNAALIAALRNAATALLEAARRDADVRALDDWAEKDIARYWCSAEDQVQLCEHDECAPHCFDGATPDEARAKAAAWVRSQPPTTQPGER